MTAIQGEILHLPPLDHAADAARIGLHQRHGSLYAHFLQHVADIELGVDAHVLVYVKRHPGEGLPAKAGMLDGKVVVSRGNEVNPVGAVLVGLRSALRVSVGVACRHFGSTDSRPGRVGNISQQSRRDALRL